MCFRAVLEVNIRSVRAITYSHTLTHSVLLVSKPPSFIESVPLSKSITRSEPALLLFLQAFPISDDPNDSLLPHPTLLSGLIGSRPCAIHFGFLRPLNHLTHHLTEVSCLLSSSTLMRPHLRN